MNQRWQFSLSSLLIAVAVLSALAALVARTGAYSVLLILLGGTPLMSIVGIARHRPALAWTGLGIFIPLLAVSIPLLFGVIVWDGHKKVPLNFVVIDAADNQPISGATVRLRKIDILPSFPIPTGEIGTIGATGQDGSVVLVWDFDTSGREGLLENFGYVYFGHGRDLWIQTSAPSYATQLVPLESLTRKSRDVSDPIPPQMQILPEPAATAKP